MLRRGDVTLSTPILTHSNPHPPKHKHSLSTMLLLPPWPLLLPLVLFRVMRMRLFLLSSLC
jgi:hypothetical protein